MSKRISEEFIPLAENETITKAFEKFTEAGTIIRRMTNNGILVNTKQMKDVHVSLED